MKMMTYCTTRHKLSSTIKMCSIIAWIFVVTLVSNISSFPAPEGAPELLSQEIRTDDQTQTGLLIDPNEGIVVEFVRQNRSPDLNDETQERSTRDLYASIETESNGKEADDGTVVEFEREKRTLDPNEQSYLQLERERRTLDPNEKSLPELNRERRALNLNENQDMVVAPYKGIFDLYQNKDEHLNRPKRSASPDPHYGGRGYGGRGYGGYGGRGYGGYGGRGYGGGCSICGGGGYRPGGGYGGSYSQASSSSFSGSINTPFGGGSFSSSNAQSSAGSGGRYGGRRFGK